MQRARRLSEYPEIGNCSARMFGRVATSDSPNKLINVPVSNVPGPRQIGRIAGAPVAQFLSVGPLTFGVGVNITVWSYVDQLNISVLADDVTETFFGASPRLRSGGSRSCLLVRVADGCCRRGGLS